MPSPLSRVRSINFLDIGDNFSKLDLMQWREIFFSANLSFRPIFGQSAKPGTMLGQQCLCSSMLGCPSDVYNVCLSGVV